MADTEHDMPLDPGVPSFVVREVGVGSCQVTDLGSTARKARLIRLFLEEGPLDLVLTDGLAALLAGELLADIDNEPVVQLVGV